MMTTNGFSFRFATLIFSACVTASCTFAQATVVPSQECQINRHYDDDYYFINCKVTNFSIHLPVTPRNVFVTFYNATILDIDGCVRWLSNISQIVYLEFRGNDSSFLDCLAKFNRSLPVTPTSDFGPTLDFWDTILPLEAWIAAMFKTLFGNATYWESVTIEKAPLVTRMPEAFGNQGVVKLRQLAIGSTSISAIREHDLDGYQFASLYFLNMIPTLYLIDNPICFVELAAFRHVPSITMRGNPIDENGKIDWKQLANRYPNATAFATNPVCAHALDTTDYQVIDTSYKGITIIQRGYEFPATTTTLPSPTTSEGSADGRHKTFVYKVVKFVKVTLLGDNEAEALYESKNLLTSDE